MTRSVDSAMMTPDPEGSKGGSYYRNMVKLKRVYDPPETGDGTRILVERLWPRGMKKEALVLDAWSKEVAPSQALRRWFGHDPAKWDEFRQRYLAELDANPQAWQPLLQAARLGTLTLLYSARDTEHNSALLLKAYLEGQLDGLPAFPVA